MNSTVAVDRLLDELRSIYGEEDVAKHRRPSHTISLADLQRLFSSSIQTSRLVSQEARLTMVSGDRESVAEALDKASSLVGSYMDGLANSLLLKSFHQHAMQSKQINVQAQKQQQQKEAENDEKGDESVVRNNSTNSENKTAQQPVSSLSPHRLSSVGTTFPPSDAPLTLEVLLEDNAFVTIDLGIQSPPAAATASSSLPSSGGNRRRSSVHVPAPASSPAASALLLLSEVHYARFLVDSTLRDMYVLLSKAHSDNNPEAVSSLLNRASHFGAKTIVESDIICRCYQRLENHLSAMLMVLDGRTTDAGGCWGDIEGDFQTSVPVAKAQMSQCVIKSRLGRHRDAMRHATISVMLLKHIVNTPGGVAGQSSFEGPGQHPRALLVAALYNLGSEQQKSGDLEAAARSFDEGYVMAVTPVSNSSGGLPPPPSSSHGGGPSASPVNPPLLPTDPLLTTLQSLASPRAVSSMRPPSAPNTKRLGGTGFVRERHHSLIHSAGVPQGLKGSGGGGRPASSPKRASTAGGIPASSSTGGDSPTNKQLQQQQQRQPPLIPPTIGGAEYNKIPFVAVSMGTGPFIGSKNDSPTKRAAYGNLFASRKLPPAPSTPRLTPLAPTAPKDDIIKKPSVTSSSRRASQVQGTATDETTRRRGASSARARLPSIHRPLPTSTTSGRGTSSKSTVTGSILAERSAGLKSLTAILLSDLQLKMTSQYEERFKCARRIQCAWRCSRSRLEAFNRRQIFLHSLYVSQKAAVTCLVSSLKCLLTKKRLHSTKAQTSIKIAQTVESERVRRQAALRITAAMRTFVGKKHEKDRLLRVLQLTHESKLAQYAAAALIVQRWWPLIKTDKAYWRQRNADIEAEREEKRIRDLFDNAATSVQRMWRGVMARNYARSYKELRATEKARTIERIRESIDCIRIVLKEMAAKKRRLLRIESEKNRLTSPDMQEAELAVKMVREAQKLIHANMLKMSRACRGIQRNFRAFLARRQLRISRRIAHTHELIRIDKEFDEYKASRKIQCAFRQHQARAVFRRKKAFKGRHIIEKIWLLQRLGRGLLCRVYIKQSAAMASAMVGFSLDSALSILNKNRHSLESSILWKISQYTKATKQQESRLRKISLQEEANWELQRDYAASRIQRQVRSVQQRARTRILSSAHSESKRVVLAKIVRMQSFIRMAIQKVRFAEMQAVDNKKKLLQRLYVEASDARVEASRQHFEEGEADARNRIIAEESVRLEHICSYGGTGVVDETVANDYDDSQGDEDRSDDDLYD